MAWALPRFCSLAAAGRRLCGGRRWWLRRPHEQSRAAAGQLSKERSKPALALAIGPTGIPEPERLAGRFRVLASRSRHGLQRGQIDCCSRSWAVAVREVDAQFVQATNRAVTPATTDGPLHRRVLGAYHAVRFQGLQDGGENAVKGPHAVTSAPLSSFLTRPRIRHCIASPSSCKIPPGSATNATNAMNATNRRTAMNGNLQVPSSTDVGKGSVVLPRKLPGDVFRRSNGNTGHSLQKQPQARKAIRFRLFGITVSLTLQHAECHEVSSKPRAERGCSASGSVNAARSITLEPTP